MFFLAEVVAISAILSTTVFKACVPIMEHTFRWDMQPLKLLSHFIILLKYHVPKFILGGRASKKCNSRDAYRKIFQGG